MTSGKPTMIANLFEKGGCTLTLALVDPGAMVSAGPSGYLSCAQTHCPLGGGKAMPPSQPPDPTQGFCSVPPPGPPPPPSEKCQKALDEFCSNSTANKACVGAATGYYPDAQPFTARYDYGCSEEPAKPWPHGVPQGPCLGRTTARDWRCYSHLALSAAGAWSNSAVHPNAYCTEVAVLEALYQACMAE